MKNPLRKKRSRYQKVRGVLREMLALRDRRPATADHEHTVPAHEHGFAGLHWLTAGLYLAAGAEAAFGERRGDYRPGDAIRWAPFVAAPLAGAAQVARALWPTPTTRIAAQVASGVALGVGAAGLASSVTHAWRDHGGDPERPTSMLERVPSLAPLAFGAVGLLALLLDTEEKEAAEAVPSLPPKKRTRSRVRSIRIRV